MSKWEKLDYLLLKPQLDVHFLCKCENSNFILNFLNFHLVNSPIKYSTTYRLCQSNLLRDFHQKKFTVRILKKEFSSLKVSLQNYLNLIDFAHISTPLSLSGINDKILKSKNLV